ncbi:MAG: hypothetical protein ACLFRT_00010 [Actinomycetota bacterium]
MARLLVAGVLLLAACSGGASDEPMTSTSPPTSTTTEASTTTEPPVECPPAPYEMGFLPTGVGEGELDTESLEPDVWTSVAGTNTTFVPRNDGTVAIALIRGTLPAQEWPAERGEVSIDGTRGVAGPHPDGTWVVGWYEEPGARCDEYSMVFYPPWDPSDVEQVIEEMNRVGG